MKKDFYWLLLILLISISLTGIFFGFENYWEVADYIQISPIYLVAIPILFYTLEIFTSVSYIVFGIVILTSKSNDIIRYWIFAIANLGNILVVSILIQYFQYEWVVYPPLSALPQPASDQNINTNSNIIYTLWGIQLVLITTLFYIGYLIREKRKDNTK